LTLPKLSYCSKKQAHLVDINLILLDKVESLEHFLRSGKLSLYADFASSSIYIKNSMCIVKIFYIKQGAMFELGAACNSLHSEAIRERFLIAIKGAGHY